MFELNGTRKQMYVAIAKHRNEDEVRIMTKPSRALFFHLLQTTKVNKIHMTNGIFATVPKKVLDALQSAGVSVHVIRKRAGRPQKFSHDKKIEALRMLQKGTSASKISEELKIPTTSIYAWVRRMKKKEVAMPDST